MKKTFLFILTAAMILTMQGFPVLAGQVPLENGTGSLPEVPPEQPESGTGMSGGMQGETTGTPLGQPAGGEISDTSSGEPSAGGVPEIPSGQPSAGGAADTPSGELSSGEASGKPEEQPGSGNGMPTEQLSGGAGTSGGMQEGTPEAPSVLSAGETAIPITEPGALELNNAMAADAAAPNGIGIGLTQAALSGHKVPSQNPPQAVVNLFDYCQDAGVFSGQHEVAHDYYDSQSKLIETYKMGISEGHLLRFGYRETNNKDDYCYEVGENAYGDWNEYSSNKPRQGIVQKRLGTDGFPVLDLNFIDQSKYGNYAKDGNREKYLTDTTKNESLAYLFLPNDNEYKISYSNVQGLFQINPQGYYYYNSKLNFAELVPNKDDPQFILYDSPGVADPKGNYGQFFPFNSAMDVFDTEYTVSDGQKYLLSYTDRADRKTTVHKDYTPVQDQGTGASFMECYVPEMNHYLGMTLEVPFLQPVDGRLPDTTPMSFEFSGDDDVWIFIDGVLVADLGGLHDAYALSIDFHSGEVKVTGEPRPHTLYDSFVAAYGSSNAIPASIAFNGPTFADNTVHTLKMFYLERGNIASNLSLSFNLQTARYNQIEKVDQNGNAVENVEFVLYPAAQCNEGEAGSILCNSTVSGTPCYVKQDGDTPLLTLRTGPNGIANFSDYTFSSATPYYILHETAPPDGYRSQPVDIVLEYNAKTTMLSVANRWEIGAYASFTSYVSEQAGVKLFYGQYNTDTGLIGKGASEVPDASRQNGLVLAVPMLQSGDKDSGVWLPLYGSNLDGFHTTGAGGADEDSMKRALLTAALNQCLYDENWYLEWDTGRSILEGRLSDLPGRADRYRHVNPDGDMQMAYIMLEPNAFGAIGGGTGRPAERYMALKKYVEAYGVSTAVNAIYGGNAANVNLLDTAQFIRVFRSLIYISNEQRELRVLKVDENGQPLNGALFGLYASIEDAQQNSNAVASGVTANVDGVDGILIFKPQTDDIPGYARMVWANAPNETYYLKEISAPDGYGVNETVVPVVVGIYSIYADAGSTGDGISVMAGAGQLYRTMAKYASDGDVNITLRDITATAQKQDSGQFALNGWQDMETSGQKQEKALHYGINKEMGMDYGLHDEDLGTTPFFKTDTGFLRVRVSQNMEALEGRRYDNAVNTAKDDLKDTDLTGLFSLLNVVVVEDWPAQGSGGGDHGSDDHEEDSGTADTEPGAETKASPTALDVLVEHLGTPQTGDDSLIWWWAVLGIISLVGIGATVCNLVFVKRKQNKDSSKKKRKKRSSKK